MHKALAATAAIAASLSDKLEAMNIAPLKSLSDREPVLSYADGRYRSRHNKKWHAEVFKKKAQKAARKIQRKHRK